MSLVQLQNVTFGYQGDELLEGVTWQINEGARIGLIGPNGTGKSTLLRLLAGELQPHVGSVARGRGVTIRTLRQSQEHNETGTVHDALLAPFRELLAMHDEMVALEPRLGEATPGELERYGLLQELFTRGGGYTLQQRVRELAESVGLDGPGELERSVATLSGGERGRLELAKVLLEAPDLLLLDEPTNHLDVAHVEKLEAFLVNYTKSFVLVSHDRRFLQAICNEIVEVDGEKLEFYVGGFERYLAERAERRERARQAYLRQQAEIARTEDFIRRNIAGQKTKQAQSRRTMLAKMERLEVRGDTWSDAGRIGLRFTLGDHPGGKDALKIQHLSVGYDAEKPLVRELDTVIYRGDRIGILGPNGAGKSTLLRSLLGVGKPPILSGTVERGVELRVGYFDQKLAGLVEDRTLIEEIRSVRGDFPEDRARDYLARFRFFGDDPFRVVKGLSGGERNRLALSKMMLEPRNMLALDEPTNHLDIPAREVLENALKEYSGTILVISHDRYFLDQIVTKVIVISQDGQVDIQNGNYTDWKRRSAAAATESRPVAAVGKTQTKGAKPSNASATKEQSVTKAASLPSALPSAGESDKAARIAAYEQQKNVTKEREKRQRRIQTLEKQVETLEVELTEARARLAEDHAGDWKRLNELVSDEQKLREKLDRTMAEWEALLSTEVSGGGTGDASGEASGA